MRRTTRFAVVFPGLLWAFLPRAISAPGVPSLPPVPPPPPIVLRHATLLDGVSADARRDVAITLRDGRIESIRPEGARQAATAAAADSVIDLQGAWVMPGMVEAHAHLGQSRMYGESDSVAAQRALDAGITTIRSLGAVAGLGDIALRQAFLAGGARLPRVLAAGQFITPIVNEEWLQNFPTLRSMLDSATAADSAKRLSPGAGWRLANNARAIDSAVGLLSAHGADWVKVFANGRAGIPTSDPRTALLSETDLRVAVRAAQRRGMRVAAHAYTDDGVRASVVAGVNTVEHVAYVSDETLKLMRERGTCLVPTLSAYEEPSEDSVVRARSAEMAPVAERAVRQAVALGVTVIAGADVGYSPMGRTLASELAALRRAGLSPDDVIRAATSRAAGCFGLSDRTGRVAPGLAADLLVLDGDPRTDLTILGRPTRVFIGGRSVRRVSLAAIVESVLTSNGIEAARARIRELHQSRVDSVRYGEFELIGLGARLGMRGKIPEAVAMFEANVEVYPTVPNAWDALGQVLIAVRRRDDALQAWTRAVELAEQQGDPRLGEFRAKLERLRRQ